MVYFHPAILSCPSLSPIQLSMILCMFQPMLVCFWSEVKVHKYHIEYLIIFFLKIKYNANGRGQNMRKNDLKIQGCWKFKIKTSNLTSIFRNSTVMKTI